MNTRQSFPKQKRLLNAPAFSHVFDNNDRRASCHCATVLSVRSPNAESRLGLVVAKKNVKLATQRNRIKRIVRESFRSHQFAQSRDIVFLARRGIADLDNKQLFEQLESLWRKLERTTSP
jgi:ribonuclease P protein component